MDKLGIAQRLTELRTSHSYTQKRLAERLGVATTTVSAYELGNNQPPYDSLIKYADIFHVSTDYILGREKLPEYMLNVEGLNRREIQAIQACIDALRKED